MSKVEKWGRERYLQFIQKTEHCTILIQTLVFRRQRTQKGQIAITFKIISLSNNQNKWIKTYTKISHFRKTEAYIEQEYFEGKNEKKLKTLINGED